MDAAVRAYPLPALIRPLASSQLNDWFLIKIDISKPSAVSAKSLLQVRATDTVQKVSYTIAYIFAYI